MDDVSQSLKKGQYAGGVMKGLRGSLAIVPAVLNDTVGSAIRSLKEPAEDIGRAALGMPDRVPTQNATAVPAPAATALKPEGLDKDAIAASEAYNRANSLRRSQDLTNVRVERQGNGNLSFSGENVTGNPNYVGGAASAIKPGDRGITSMPASNFVSAAPSADMAAFEAKKAALLRGESLEGGGGQNLTPSQSPFRGSQLRNARLQAETQHIQGLNPLAERGQDITMRGQDLSYDSSMTGHLMGQKAAQARLRWDMAKDARDFDATRGDKNFDQRQSAKKAIDDQIDSRFVNPETNKPDAAQTTEYKQFLQNFIAETAKQAAARGDKATAAKLQGRSYADLDPEDLQAAEQLWQNRATAKKSSGWAPGTGHFTDSLNPYDYAAVGVDKRTFGGDHVQLRNGNHYSVNDATGSTWGIGPKQSGAQDTTIEAAVRNQRLRDQGK